MAILPILIAPDPILKQKATLVGTVTPQIVQLMDDMLQTMYEAPGIGLAAPQVGVLKRVIVVDISREGEEKTPLKMADPEIVWVSEEDQEYEEGCLSVPEHYSNVVRPAAIRVRYTDQNNKKVEISADGLLAVCIQHEIDHLDGILFLDHISSLKRNMILRKLLKQKKLAS
ncbi:peptide deformylase [Lacibacterium aquatile]|uniref:Peptide deformylase n=1 Tax=Lacibacterium aquatile TaxID=1168082 RepID=A0ABW5DMG5_9PROT